MYPATVTVIIVINCDPGSFKLLNYGQRLCLRERGNDRFRTHAIQTGKIKTCLLNNIRECGMRGALRYMMSVGK